METEITREHLDNHIHKRLRIRVRMYLGISLLILIAIIYRIVAHGGGVIYPIIALLIGLTVGTFLSRMYLVEWDTDAEKVVSRIDVFGGIILALYIGFEITGEHFIREWFHGAETLTMILSLAGGAVLGRGIGIGRKMIAVLKENI